MTGSLVVDLNQDGLHTLSVPATFETSESFDVRLKNHGEAAHVYLHLDDDLSAVAALEGSHHYITRDDIQVVHVAVADGARASGTLEVTTAHGGTTERVTVDVGPQEREKPSVEVDESLSNPAPREEPDPLESFGGTERLPVLALGGVAVVLALSTLAVDGTAAMVLGALAVLTAVVAAAYVALSRE
ncbi:DUF7524 family protein [Halomarina litorea]|uniref:DUF7524 family protein n=1 Tax=Halomarina litorea TaxID=2961595 RepID=UPI003F64639F